MVVLALLLTASAYFQCILVHMTWFIVYCCTLFVILMVNREL